MRETDKQSGGLGERPKLGKSERVKATLQFNSPILFRISINAPELMRLLLAHGADLLHENSTGENAFFLACRLNRATLVHILCTELAGLDINMRQNDARGFTALHVAALHNSLDVARVLLELECDVWAKSKTTGIEYPVDRQVGIDRKKGFI